MMGKTEEEKSGARLGSLLMIAGLVTDEQMAQGMLALKEDLGQKVEGPAGGAVAFAQTLSHHPDSVTVCVLSGGNVGAFPE